MDLDYNVADEFNEQTDSEEMEIGTKIRKQEKIGKNSQNDAKKQTKAIYSIFAMQNAILNKIVEDDYNNNDIFSFLVYDLMIKHDSNFVALKQKLLTEYKKEAVIQKCNKSFLLELVNSFKEKENDLLNSLKGDLERESTYIDDLLVYSPKLCNLIFNYLDISLQNKCWKVEIEDKRKFNYNNFRKFLMNDVQSMAKESIKNVKLMGGAIYRESKRNRLGKCNGFTTDYLSINKESEGSVKRIKNKDSSPKTITTDDKKKMMKMEFSSTKDNFNQQTEFKKPLKFINYDTKNFIADTKDTPTLKKEEKSTFKSIFAYQEEMGALFNEEFLIEVIHFDEEEEDPDLRYKILFKEDWNDEWNFRSKLPIKNYEESESN